MTFRNLTTKRVDKDTLNCRTSRSNVCENIVLVCYVIGLVEGPVAELLGPS